MIKGFLLVQEVEENDSFIQDFFIVLGEHLMADYMKVEDRQKNHLED